MNITQDVRYIGVDDKEIDLFEGQYPVPKGMAYNSYAILDEKTAIFDTVDARFTHEWLDNVKTVLASRQPDYLIVQHMEPDHSANILTFMRTYPNATIVSSAKAFAMMQQFFGTDFSDRRLVVAEKDVLSLGKHTLTFITTPMVHWPEVIVTYDSYEKILFSADGFGKFGTFDADEPWKDEARRYYIGIVGKYGMQVQNLLKKAAELEIQTICPLHGPVLKENLGEYLNLYHTWSSYAAEEEGVAIAFASVYGNTKKAAELLAEKLKINGCPKVVLHDLARCDLSEAIADAFRYGKLVLASPTYNADIFPFMDTFIKGLSERNFQNRMVALIENGTWAPTAAKIMREKLAACKKITFSATQVTIRSALNEESLRALETLSEELCEKNPENK